MDSGTISQLVFVIFGAGVFLYGLILHKELSRFGNANDRSRLKLDATLRNFYDEIPSLLVVLNPSLPDHGSGSQALLQAHAECLAATGIMQKSAAHARLEKALKGFLVANRGFVESQSRIAELNESVAAARDSYNDHVIAYNARIGQFPDVFVASVMGLQRRDVF